MVKLLNNILSSTFSMMMSTLRSYFVIIVVVVFFSYAWFVRSLIKNTGKTNILRMSNEVCQLWKMAEQIDVNKLSHIKRKKDKKVREL